MTTQQVALKGAGLPATKATADFVTMTVADQTFGIPVLDVRDVLGPQNIAHVPLAPSEVAGALNLRGRIVTAIDMRRRLELPNRPSELTGMSVVVDHEGELFSLIVDKVGEVMSLPVADFENNPPTLNPQWREVSTGIYRLKNQLLIVLDIVRFLRIGSHIN